MPAFENVEDQVDLAQLFQTAHQQLLPHLLSLNLHPMSLNLHATQEQVDHAGTNDLFQEIAIRLPGVQFASLTGALAAGVIAHEYGHQYYRRSYPGIYGIPTPHEELACDQFAAVMVSKLGLNRAPYANFLRACRPENGNHQYPPLRDSIKAVVDA